MRKTFRIETTVGLVRTVSASLVALLPSIALAQVTGTRIEPMAPRADPDRVLGVMVDCYAKRYPAEAVEYLALLPGSTAAAKRYGNMAAALEVCLGGRDMVFDADYFANVAVRYRRALAKALVQKNAAQVPVSLPVDAATGPWFVSRIAGTADYNAATISLEEFADCVARRDWQAARTLSLSKPKSGDEKRAVATLTPFLVSCVPAGQTMNIQRVAIPAVVAEAVYHIALGPALEARQSGRAGR